MKRMKRFLAIMLALIMILGTMTVAAFAEENTNTDDLYDYTWTNNSDGFWSWSPHRLHVKVAGEEITDESMCIFYLKKDLGDSVERASAYCCDLKTYIKSGTAYKRINLEDSTYYSDANAQKIRGIFKYGYWTNSTAETLKSAENAANQWLKANPDVFVEIDADANAETPTVKVSQIKNLTAAEALAATQQAIWNYANEKDETTGIIKGYTVSKNATRYLDQLINSNEPKGENTEANILLFFKFLINQGAQLPEDIILTDNYFIENLQKIETPDGDKYDLALYFQLAGTVDASDDLVFTATAGDNTQTLTIGKDGMKADANGYYHVVFNDVTAADLEKEITMNIKGTQNISGVYFYEAKPVGDKNARDTSQNLVGRYDGATEVYAENAFKLALVDEYYMSGSIKVTKEVLVSDVHFKNDETYYVTLFADAALTDPIETKAIKMDGKAENTVEFTDLSVGATYYIAETDANGKVIEAGDVGASKIVVSQSAVTIPQPEDKTSPVVNVTISNCYDDSEYFYEETTDDSNTEEEESTDEESQTGDDSNMTVYFGLMLAALAAMAAAFGARRRRN